MSTASSTPAGGWYADPLDASLLRWWDGATWSKQTMPADPAQGAPSEDVKAPLTAVPPLLTAVPRIDEPYVPPNSVFRMAEATVGDAYLPEWSGLADISDEVALSGVPVQLALTSTPSEPPIPVSADVFPTLHPEALSSPAIKDPVWKVEEPLAAPIDQLFPVASAATAFPTAPASPVAPVESAFPAPVAPAVAAPTVAPAVAAPTVAAPTTAALTPVVSLDAPISPTAVGSTLSADVFPMSAPVIAPVIAPAAPALVPQPAGDAFPGIVPNAATAPTIYAEPPAPAEPVAPVAHAPTPVAPALPEPTIYAGPAPLEVGANPVAPPEFQPFAASTPGASYVPLAPRPIPQPLQLGAPAAPAAPAMPAEVVPATPNAPVEYWPTQGTPPGAAQYQPNPGDYVPFDPNSVRLEPVPVIPFSSRDPYNSASTSRPGMRAYASAPVGPSGSTWTGGLAFMLLAPLITTATFFVWTQLTTTGALSLSSSGWLPFALAAISLIGLASAQIDRSALARRGYFDLASPFWVLLLPPLVYLIVRATRLRGQGRGAAPAIGLWVLSYVAGSLLLGVIAIGWLATPTPERVAMVESSIQQEFAAKGATVTVNCAEVTSLAPGASFTCTVTSKSSSLPMRVTVGELPGDYNVAPVTSNKS